MNHDFVNGIIFASFPWLLICYALARALWDVVEDRNRRIRVLQELVTDMSDVTSRNVPPGLLPWWHRELKPIPACDILLDRPVEEYEKVQFERLLIDEPIPLFPAGRRFPTGRRIEEFRVVESPTESHEDTIQ
jgi:hypothetical protein